MRRRDFISLVGASAAVWPLATAAFAQQATKVPRVAIVSSARPPDRWVIGAAPQITAFFEQMQSHGFIEGSTVLYERYLVRNGQAPSLLPPIIATAPDVIYLPGADDAALVGKAINKTIPMVAYVTDLLALGVVSNVAHPGGNITGVSTGADPDIVGKRLTLLAEAVPSAKSFAYVVSGANGRPLPEFQGQFDVVGSTARKLGVTLTLVLIESAVSTEANYARAFATMAADRVDAAYFGDDSTHLIAAPIIGRLALAAKLPTMGQNNSLTDEGAMLSYGIDSIDGQRQCADQIALILRGAKPGDLPVLQPTLFNFVANLKTAKAIGVTLPTSILAQATQVIE